MQGSLRTKQLACLFYPFFVSGLRSEHCNLPRCTLAESGLNMANRHTTHSATLSPKDPSVRVHQSILWDMSWRLGACDGFHLIHPLVHFATHSWYCGTQFRLLLGWCFQLDQWPFLLATSQGPARTRAVRASSSTHPPSLLCEWTLLPFSNSSPLQSMMKTSLKFAVSTLAPSTYRVLL